MIDVLDIVIWKIDMLECNTLSLNLNHKLITKIIFYDFNIYVKHQTFVSRRNIKDNGFSF